MVAALVSNPWEGTWAPAHDDPFDDGGAADLASDRLNVPVLWADVRSKDAFVVAAFTSLRDQAHRLVNNWLAYKPVKFFVRSSRTVLRVSVARSAQNGSGPGSKSDHFAANVNHRSAAL